MDDEERLVKTEKLREKYAAEFERHGISRLGKRVISNILLKLAYLLR